MKVGLVQINIDLTWANSSNGEVGPEVTFEVLPYSVGLLQAYATANAREQHEWLHPVHRRWSVAESADRLEGADLVGFSAYIWNVELSLAIAREIKSRNPDVIIVFGGPQVPDRPEEWLRAHPEVDVACHGEGEHTFTEILNAAPRRAWDEVAGVSFVRDGELTIIPRGPRIKDLDVIPSPFTSGAFDSLIGSLPNARWITMWETNRGCPFSCAFCDWGSATASKVHRFGMERLMSEVDWMADKRIEAIFCCDANFGMLKRDYEIAEAVVAAKERAGAPHSLSVQNTKNAIERGYKVQKLINQKLNAYGATISLQSSNPETLSAIKRDNISSDAFRELQARFAAEGVYTYTDLIIGLPGDTYETFADSISQVVADGQHNHIQFHNCSVLPNAQMGHPLYQQRYGLRTVPQTIRNVHDRKHARPPEVEEYLPLVIATDALGDHDWPRAKTLAWLSDLLYFDRLLQIPFALLSDRHDVRVHKLIEGTMAAVADRESFPVLAGLHDLLSGHANAIQQGGDEYLHRTEYADMLWPADQFAILELAANDRFDAFYEEAGRAITAMLPTLGAEDDAILMDEALRLNQAAFVVPFVEGDTRVALSHPLWEAYWSVLRGTPFRMRESLSMYVIDRTSRRAPTIEAYCRHLAWAGSKDKRGYLYPLSSPMRRPPREPSTSSPTLVSS